MEDFEKKIRDSKECIEKNDASDSKKIYQMANTKASASTKISIKNLFTWKLITKYAIIVLMLALMFTGGFFLSKSLNKGNEKIVEKEKIIYRDTAEGENITVNYDQVAQNITPASFGSFDSKEELISYLNNNKNNVPASSGSAGWFSLEDTDVREEDGIISIKPNQGSSSSTYQTNTQVENVDEADIVKVKDNHIFYLSINSYKRDYCLFMFTEEEGKLEESKSILYSETTDVLKIENGYELVKRTRTVPNDLYVTDKYLVVRISKNEWKATRPVGSTYDYNFFDRGYTCMFEVYDVNTLDLVTKIETAGTNVSTRLIDNTLYVVNNYNDFLRNDNSYYFYPYFFVAEDIYYPFINRIYICDGSGFVNTYVSIYKIKLDEEITVEDLHILTPSINNIYSSEKNIYLIRSYGSEYVKEEEYQLSYSNSRVVVVNIEGNLSLSGSFDVKGSIGNKYWIDEKDEYIRVVTSGTERKSYYFNQKYIYKSESNIFNHITIFKKTEDGFTQTSAITEGLGKPGETVRSARFNGDLVTIVTFRNTDPIYYVDISDPNNPVITSALEITGYSIYQHPYKDNYVIGFGYEGNGISSGLKITLFDVSDKENIKTVGNSYVIKNNVTTSYGNYYRKINYSTPDFYSEPKALFVDNELGLFGFRLSGNNRYYEKKYNSSELEYSQHDPDKSSYEYYYFILTIDENSEDPIKLTQIAKTEIPYRKATGDSYTYYYEQGSFYDRLVFIGDNYYLLSNKKVDCFKMINNELVKNKTLDL